MKFRVLSACLIMAATALFMVSCNESDDLPRRKPSKALETATESYVKAIDETGMNIHSVMIVKKGKVVFEKWMGEGEKNTPHVLHSVSKTFTATAVGMAVDQGLLTLEDKVVDFSLKIYRKQ